MNQGPIGKVVQVKKAKSLLALEIFLTIVVSAGLIVGLIYYLGKDQPHTDVPHALDEVFALKEQALLKDKLQKKAYQHTVLHGDEQSGIFEFLEHYADQRAAKGSLVIVRRVEDNLYETALKFIRYTKSYLDENLNLDQQVDSTQWVFAVKNGEVPLNEIESIKTRRPKDRIVVGSIIRPLLKGFKILEYPAIKIKDIEGVIRQDFNISAKSARILTNFYGTVPHILQNLDSIEFSAEQHLGEHYRNASEVTKNQQATLKKLCSKGTATLGKSNVKLLSELGVLTYNNSVYWEDRYKRLNYELSKQVQCVDTVVPEDIRDLVDDADEQEQQVKDPQPAKKQEKKQKKDQKEKEKNTKNAKTQKPAKKQPAKQQKGAKANTSKQPTKQPKQTKTVPAGSSQTKSKVKAEVAKQKSAKKSK